MFPYFSLSACLPPPSFVSLPLVCLPLPSWERGGERGRSRRTQCSGLPRPASSEARVPQTALAIASAPPPCPLPRGEREPNHAVANHKSRSVLRQTVAS